MINRITGINQSFIWRKLDKLPDKLIYHYLQEYSKAPSEDVFTIFFTGDSKKYAVMYCAPMEVYRKDLGLVKSLSVEYIYNAAKEHSGLGKSLIEFAKIYSYRIGCGGRINLFASKGLQFEEYPHLFYKKCGFNTGIPLIDKKMDKYLKRKVKPENAVFPTLQMFYPPIKTEQPPSALSRCLKFLGFNK